MSTSLEEYKQLIDDLLGWPRVSVTARRVREWGTSGEKPYQITKELNHLMAQLTNEQRQTIAEMLQATHDEGMFAVLAYLSDEINLRGLRLTRNGVELAVEPYSTELYWDWTARRDGAAWPDSTDRNEDDKPDGV
jgi:hypothetical protein